MNQLENRSILEARIKEVCETVPKDKECDHLIAEYSVKAAKELLAGNNEEAARLKKEVAVLKERKKSTIAEAGFPEDYLEMVYSYRDCKDTGYINGKSVIVLNKR